MIGVQKECWVSLMVITQRRMVEATTMLEFLRPHAVLDLCVHSKWGERGNQEVVGLRIQGVEVILEEGAASLLLP